MLGFNWMQLVKGQMYLHIYCDWSLVRYYEPVTEVVSRHECDFVYMLD